VIGRVLYWRAEQRLATIARQGQDPGPLQDDALLRMVRRAAETRFGRAHGFDAIRTVEEYRDRVPVQDYASLLPYFERARDGAEDETWPGVPESFAMTSGTTGGDKYLPHTKSSLKSQLEGAGDALAAYLVRARDRGLFGGRIAFFGGSLTLRRFPSGMPWGDNTGILAGHTPAWVRPFRVPSAAALAIENWEERLAAAARELARCDVRLLIGLPSWILLLLDAVEQEADAPIRDVWPAWRGFLHGGMAFQPYAETFRRRVGTGVVFVDTYSATEGGMLAVQDREDDPAMTVILDRNVHFEFLDPVDPTGPRVGIGEVVPGLPYLLCVTTDAGLWSYRIGDLVRFTSVRPPRIVFHGRETAFLSAFGENVSQAELESAVAGAAAEQGCEVREFAVVPEFPDARRPSGRHMFVIECGRPPADLDAFGRAVDRAIRRGNADYAAHRGGDRQLRPPAVRLVHRGTFYDWMRERGRSGARAAVPRVIDRAQAEALLRRASARISPQRHRGTEKGR